VVDESRSRKCELLTQTPTNGTKLAGQCGVHHRVRVYGIRAEVMSKVDLDEFQAWIDPDYPSARAICSVTSICHGVASRDAASWLLERRHSSSIPLAFRAAYAASGIKMRRGTGNFPSLAASSSDYKEFRKAINCCCSLGDNFRSCM